MVAETREILIYAEHHNNCIDSSVLSLIAKVRSLIKNKKGWSVCAVMIGQSLEIPSQELAQYVDKIYAYSSNESICPDHMFYADLITTLLKEKKPEILLFGVSNFTSILSATLGVRMKTGVIAHAVDIRLDENDLLVSVIPAFGGQYLGDILCPKYRPQIASIRLAKEMPEKMSASGEVEIFHVSFEKQRKYQYSGEIKPEEDQAFLENAEVIVCGGFGVGSAENWHILEEVAHLLGGAVGCTRPPVDEGWGVDERSMIGISGKYVSPKVYIGFGVSGTSHHVCGMRDSGKIFNINKDQNAASIALSDYVIIGDAAEYLIALRDMLH